VVAVESCKQKMVDLSWS